MDRCVFALRTSWPAIVAGLLGGLVLQVVVPVGNAWLAAVAGAACLLLFALCLAVALPGARGRDIRGLARTAVIEGAGTMEQFAYAFATSGFGLVALYLGMEGGRMLGL